MTDHSACLVLQNIRFGWLKMTICNSKLFYFNIIFYLYLTKLKSILLNIDINISLLFIHSSVYIYIYLKSLLRMSLAEGVYHNIMLPRLSKRLGVGGIALKWFESYLKGRKQSVVINETLSSPVDVMYGVPQGSVLGSKLFTIYALPIADIARKYIYIQMIHRFTLPLGHQITSVKKLP